jgi:uncharacterized protein (DUF1330 family)
MARRSASKAASSRPSHEAWNVGLRHFRSGVRGLAAFERYRTVAAKSIAQYSGRYLGRGGAASAAEGGPPLKNIIVVEFPSMERLREWYASPEYAEALKERRTALDRRLFFVEGVPPA